MEEAQLSPVFATFLEGNLCGGKGGSVVRCAEEEEEECRYIGLIWTIESQVSDG